METGDLGHFFQGFWPRRGAGQLGIGWRWSRSEGRYSVGMMPVGLVQRDTDIASAGQEGEGMIMKRFVKS